MYRYHKQVSHRLYQYQQSAYHLFKNLTSTIVTTPQSIFFGGGGRFLRNLRGFTKGQSNQNADVLEAESSNSLTAEMKISEYMALPSELILRKTVLFLKNNYL